MALVELVVNPDGGLPGAPAIIFRITRVADDLPESAFGGKGGVSCQHRVIFLWSQGRAFDSPDTPATPAVAPAPDCAVSPDATHEANGHLLSGKRGGGMFIYPAAGRVFAAHRPEKFLVFLDPLPTSPPSPLLVHGRNRSTGTATVF